MPKTTVKKEKVTKVSEIKYKMSAVIRTGDFSNVGVELELTGTDLETLKNTATAHIDTLIAKYNNYNATLGIHENLPVSQPAETTVFSSFVEDKTELTVSNAFLIAKQKLEEAQDDTARAFIIEKIKSSTKLTDTEKELLLK